MTDRPIELSPSGPPETILDGEDPMAVAALDAAKAVKLDLRRDAVAAVVGGHLRFLDAWAQLGALGRDDVAAYAAYRVGYHRGLDRLRANGWRGSGYVRWEHAENRGFLRCVAGLAETAEKLGEMDEAERCQGFLRQLDPSWPPADLG